MNITNLNLHVNLENATVAYVGVALFFGIVCYLASKFAR